MDNPQRIGFSHRHAPPQTQEAGAEPTHSNTLCVNDKVFSGVRVSCGPRRVLFASRRSALQRAKSLASTPIQSV
jgi:hypothetical protein